MDFHLIINTVKGFISKPSEEWQKIKANPITKREMLIKIIVPLIIVYVVATLLGSIISYVIRPYVLQFVGFGRLFVYSLVNSLLMGAVIFGLLYGGSFVLLALADKFGAKKDDTLTLKVMTFSYIVSLVSSIAQIIPFIGWLVVAAGSVYSLILLFWGMRDVLEPQQDKMVVYFILTLLIIIVAGAILSVLVGIVAGLILGGAMLR